MIFLLWGDIIKKECEGKVMTIEKKNIVFLDTNILSDIGRFEEKEIRDIVFQLSVDMKLLVAVTPFNILEVEKIPDEAVRLRIRYFLNLVNAIFLKGMDVLFEEEINFYLEKVPVNPMQFITTFVSKSKDGKPFNYLSVLDNLLANGEYQKALEEHHTILKKQQSHFQNKLSVTNDAFVEILFKEHLANICPCLVNAADTKEIAKCCPSYIAYAYSLYDKIGSKGIRKKAGEMNDTAMSYIFPYVGIVVTERRQAMVFNAVKAADVIPALRDTSFLKYSDVFVDGKFKLKEALSR